jgi:hypothetical protein
MLFTPALMTVLNTIVYCTQLSNLTSIIADEKNYDQRKALRGGEGGPRPKSVKLMLVLK